MMHTPLSFVPPIVGATIEGSYGHHRTPWFEGVLERIGASLAPALGRDLTPLMLTATAPGGREAIVSNCAVPGLPVWASPGGSFAALLETWDVGMTSIDDVLAGRAHSAPAGGAPLVLLDHADPSGRLLDLRATIEQLRQAAPEACIVADLSVTFAADIASVAGVGLDACIIVPEGALMGIPGLTIVAVNRRLLSASRERRPALAESPFYFDLLKYEKSWAKRTTPFSPNISAAVALCKALELIDAGGGLERHVERHAARAAYVRSILTPIGVSPASGGGPVTNAWTTCELPSGIDARQVVEALGETLVRIAAVSDNRLRIDHTGYLPADALRQASEALAGALSTATPHPFDATRVEHAVHPVSPAPVAPADIGTAGDCPPNIPPDRRLPIFDIPSREFIAQALAHARREKGGAEYERAIAEGARATFRDPHRWHEGMLAARTVGFIGAGNIVRHAVDMCREIGIGHLMVYSPTLAHLKRTGQRGGDGRDHRTLEYWQQRGVEVADSSADVFLRAHTVVLLPWFYDEQALQAFAKPPLYLNEGLVSADVLAAIEREGHADLLINAAARAGLVDRAALFRAVSAGWLRYSSDELPAPGDPLLTLRNARFTGHVGGSCSRPQAIVARNTHRILRQVMRQIAEGGELQRDAAPDYTINVANASLPRMLPWRSGGLADVVRGTAIRVLITDSFDLAALDFDRLRAEGRTIEVRDISAEKPTTERLSQELRDFRPHILMVRSRTRVEAAIADVAAGIPELCAIVRPGVGIDNLYSSVQQLTALGIQIINEPYGNSRAVAEMTLHFIVSAAQTVLLAPGPTRIEPEVFSVMADYCPPSTTAFRAAEADVRRRLGAWFGSAADPVVVSGSGTALMEAGIVNLTSAGDHGLVIVHGKFGERFVEIARAHRRTVDVLAVPESRWGAAIAVEEIERYFQSRAERPDGRPHPPVSFLCLQQNETSSGVAYHPADLARIVRAARGYSPGIMVIVDAISGAFAHALEFDALDLDLMIVGSHKGLGVSSGLAYAPVSRRALERMLDLAGYERGARHWADERDAVEVLARFERRQKIRYLNLLRLLRGGDAPEPEDPPSVFHVLSTRRSLDLHDRDGGPAAVLDRHARMAARVRAQLADAGLMAMASAPQLSNSVTPALLPEDRTAPDVRRQLEATYGIVVAGAQGDYWKSRMIRIGHLGFVYPEDIARCMRGLRIIGRQQSQAHVERLAAT